MSKKKIEFKISGIKENNLKNIEFSGRTGEVIVIYGVSGSGKSTLVNGVIATEAHRQSMIRRKTDDLFYYSVRPNINTATFLPDPIIISQRAILQSISSTFGTRTGLNDLLVRLFVKRGEIHYLGEQISKPNINIILEFQKKYYPSARLFGRISQYENINKSHLINLLKKNGIDTLIARNDKSLSFSKFSLSKILSTSLSGYELFIDLDVNNDIETLLKKTGVTPILVGSDIEVDFLNHGVSLKDGKIFRLPSKLLFSRSTKSSLSGCCLECEGTGRITSYDSLRAINKKSIISTGFLTVPLMGKSGRYAGFKFLPSGLTRVLKGKGVDVSKSFIDISDEQKLVVLTVLNNKLSSNKNDPVAQQFLTTYNCSTCDGTGLDSLARAVTINKKSIDYFFRLTAYELNEELLELPFTDEIINNILTILRYTNNLSIEHISLNRTITSMSSGELQRMKLLPVLINKYSDKIIILDEPSSNLQYRDNLKILRLINELKSRNNCIIIVDHNYLYQTIADRCLKIGPGAGIHGGNYSNVESLSQPYNIFRDVSKIKNISNTISFKSISLKSKRNIQLNQIDIPKKMFTAVIGSSGSGKSTLCRELIYPALDLTENVLFFDSIPPKGNSNSIVATYLNIFDKIRRLYANNNDGNLQESDFSFNSSGACYSCQGSGLVNNHVCSVCFGSRFKSETSLIKVYGRSISELLASDIDELLFDNELAFLFDAIYVLKSLALSHISFGRETTSLSGGELQRLKLARFILANQKISSTEDYFIILDEPCRGLDTESIEHLYHALQDYLNDATVIVIEHNPHFIYRCNYIIDLGEASGIKNKETITQGFLGEKLFQSLNYEDVINESLILNTNTLAMGVETKIDIDDLDAPQKYINNKRYDLIPMILIQQKNFVLEKEFSENFKISISDNNINLYKSKAELEGALAHEIKFFFNPFISLLERFTIIPNSLLKKIINKINKKYIVCDSDVWNFKVVADSFEEAYLKGSGVVIVSDKKEQFFYHSVRLFSIQEKISDRIFPHNFAFNLYKNSCDYCQGYGYIRSYPLIKWLNSSRSVLDNDFMVYPLHKVIPKLTIKKFAKEGLFDFSKAVNKLSSQELNILLYGFKAYKFKKEGKKDNTEASFYEWRGINSYIYRNMEKLSPNKDLTSYLNWETCPFCSHGFQKNINSYMLEGCILSDLFRPIKS